MAKGKLQVTARALLKRINLRLKASARVLKKRHPQADETLGDYYLVGAAGIVARDVNLATFARELDVLKPWERLAPEDA